jgi:hypothetical protein
LSKPAPEKPGTTFPLKFPVLLVSDRKLKVYDDEDSLTTTTTANGTGYTEYQVIASDGMTHSILKQTQFGRRAWFMDMGTTPFHVFLEMKKGGVNNVAESQSSRPAFGPRTPRRGGCYRTWRGDRDAKDSELPVG